MPTGIEAAGGVLWRPADTRLGVEIALVHRPGRDDWSLPKGKLLPGEHPVLGAMREVAEETGRTSSLGPALGATRYLKSGLPKRVRYWSLAAVDGEFSAGKEIDDLVWLPPDAAQRLALERDRPVIERFQVQRAHHARPLLLVRPGSVRQATVLAELLSAYDVRRVLTADAPRCEETLRPFAQVREVERQPVGRLAELAPDGVPTVVCAPQRLLPRLCREISSALGRRIKGEPPLPKGGIYALHLGRLDGTGSHRLLGPERILTTA